MGKKILTFAGAMVLLALMGKFLAVPVIAQVRAALVQDRDQPARNDYQLQLSCVNVTNPCTINFPAVPAGKRLVIQQASVLVKTNTSADPSLAELRGGAVYQFLPLTPVLNNFGGQFESVANQPVLAYYDTGQTPQVDVFVVTNVSFTALANISGYMIDVP